MTPEELVEIAIAAREQAYIPYSGFAVGAALLCKDGSVYGGCNIENAAYGPSNCAERTAIFKAVSEGKKEFQAMAIVGGKKDARKLLICSPCGVCRQVLREFCADDFLIYLGTRGSDGRVGYETHRLGEILPFSFGPDSLA